MWRFAAVLGAAALAAGAAGAAPVPVQTRAQAVAQLKAAIEDERRALELLKKDPPHLRAARDRIYRAADRVNGVYDFLSGVPDAAAGQDALGGARADDYAAAHLLPTHYGPRPAGLARAIEFLERALLRKRAGLPFVAGRAASARCRPVRGRKGQRSRRDHRLDVRAGLHVGPRRARELAVQLRRQVGDRERPACADGLVLGHVLRGRVHAARRRAAERPL